MKKNNFLNIRITDTSVKESLGLKKVVGYIDPRAAFSLISVATLDANPRFAKAGKVTDAIIDSLEKTPELFIFKSKGILVSARSVKELDRSRYRIEFEDLEMEGILDGGHNTLAIGIFLLSKCISGAAFKIKTWEQLQAKWSENIDNLENYLDNLPEQEFFEIPCELIFPQGDTGYDQYVDNILDISSARNNNSELSEATRANHAGYYEELSKRMDPHISSLVEWKANDSHKKYKAQEIVSLALIPFIAIQESGKLNIREKISKVALYSSKGQCVKVFNDIIKAYSSRDEKGELIINDPLILSAFDMMKTIPKLYDIIYMEFPKAYNTWSKGFGRQSIVDVYDPEEHRTTFKTKFYQKNVDYRYPDGFIYPIIASLTHYMEVRDNIVKWKVKDIESCIKENLPKMCEFFIGHIKTLDHNPQYVGKKEHSYVLTSINKDAVIHECS